MAYENAKTITQNASLMADSGRLNSRLHDICERLEKVADTLHGSSPRDASGGVPTPSNSVRRNIDSAHENIQEIESILDRIESHL